MSQIFILTFLLYLPHCILSEIVLYQPASELLKPSSTLRLSCKVSGGSLTDSTNMYAVHWIHQPSGSGLEWMARIMYENSKNYNPSVQSRLTVSRDTAKNEVYLEMTGTRTEDSGTYYCARDLGGGSYFDHWGSGTMVTVTTAEQSAPNLFPLISCGESQSPITIGCLAKDFMPDSIILDWTDSSNNNFTNGYKKYPSVYSTRGTYTTSSQITVPKPEGSSQETYFCEATHLNKKFRIAVPPAPGKQAKIPTISLHAPSRDDFTSNKEGIIVCFIKNFYPEAISVKFLKDGKAVAPGNITNIMQKDEQGDFTLVSNLQITQQDWNQGRMFTCEVNHAASGTQESRNISASTVCDSSTAMPTGIVADAVPPSFEDIYDTKEAKLTCLVKNMQSTEGLKVTWYKIENEKEVALKTKVSDPVYHNNFYSATGTATVCATEWNEGNKFICKVSHPDEANLLSKDLQKEKGEPRSPPSVYILPPPSEELALKESATVTCLVKGFSPNSLFVKWTVQDQEVSKEAYVNTEPIRETTSSGAQAYSMYSRLTIDEKSWSGGDSYTCVVGHESLPLQVVQKSVDKSSGKPTSVNVSLVMSDSANTCYQ